ncbi:ATP-binding domain-containing protein [Sphaerisporangium dianthi]|uniref:ATP-binding domain-containing protein n=1 Tax=Sphaerisporangium dianthi TaxID=1436120 RepID=A0ABV9CUH8_9ACTN
MTHEDHVLRAQIEGEQRHLRTLYERLDALRGATAGRLAAASRENGGTPQARSERDAAVARHAERLARLEAADDGLCFGRLDLRDGGRRYIGRVGLRAEDDEGDPLLIDWRAPAARPFYVATALAPEGVRRRRHIVTRGRRVVDLDDEILTRPQPPGRAEHGSAVNGPVDGTPSADSPPPATAAEDRFTGQGEHIPLVGGAALLAAVSAERTGRMHDIVATLQAEQDAVIRSGHRGVLVVQGGPGTGKTAVALHRAAYLLYTQPRLAAGGVLVVGPSAAFLTYIGRVLPGLGETGALLSTVAGLYPGVEADRGESLAAAEVKGRAEMAAMVAAAVREHRTPPVGGITVEAAGERLLLDGPACRRAAGRAARTGLPYNRARQVFAREVIADLARRLAGAARDLADRLEADIADVLAESGVREAIRADLAAMDGVFDRTGDQGGPGDLLGAADVPALERELRHDSGVRAAIEALWPALTPQRLLEGLYADPSRLERAAPGLTPAERALLVRAPGGGWSPADVPLLDEAAELLGEDDQAARARESREHARRVAYAQGVLDIAAASRGGGGAPYAGDGPSGPGGADPLGGTGDVLTAADLIDARALAERHHSSSPATVAERARADRTWAFGHVIVDEAQELSPMAWRMLMRRCPGRSMTVVGDLAQTGDPAGASSWEQVLGPHVGDRFRLVRLSVNYRTPAEIMTAAADLLAAISPGTPPARSVRRTGVRPWRVRTTAAALPTVLAELAAAETAAGGGRLAVIVPQARASELGAAVAEVVPDVSFGPHPDLTRPAVVLGVRQAKGLEFDAVLVADPARIVAASPRGRNDLYVALTRATRRLGVLHAGPPPPEIARTITERRTVPE